MPNKSKNKMKQSDWDIFWEPLTNLTTKLKIAEKRGNNKNSRKTYGMVLLLAALMPLFAWMLGALVNPDGWMSDSPVIAYIYAVLLIGNLWYIFVPIIVVFCALALINYGAPRLTYKIFSVMIFVVSLIASIIAFTFIKDADSSEFTG